MSDEEKCIAWRWGVNDQVISRIPCKLWGVVLTGDGAGVADITLRDGHSTTGDVILTLKAVQNGSEVVIFEKPIKTVKGLFLDVGSNVTGALVLWDLIE